MLKIRTKINLPVGNCMASCGDVAY